MMTITVTCFESAHGLQTTLAFEGEDMSFSLSDLGVLEIREGQNQRASFAAGRWANVEIAESQPKLRDVSNAT